MNWRSLVTFWKPSRPELPFDELRRQCIQGNSEAHREFIVRYESLVWRAVLARLPRASEQDCEEVVSNTFLSLLKDNAELLQRYNSLLGLSPKSYIYRQASLQAVNRYRKLTTEKRRHEVTSASTPSDNAELIEDTLQQPSAEALLATHEMAERLHTLARESLPPKLLITFELMFVCELSPEEIGEILNCSVEVIYQRKHRILHAIEELMDKDKINRNE